MLLINFEEKAGYVVGKTYRDMEATFSFDNSVTYIWKSYGVQNNSTFMPKKYTCAENSWYTTEMQCATTIDC